MRFREIQFEDEDSELSRGRGGGAAEGSHICCSWLYLLVPVCPPCGFWSENKTFPFRNLCETLPSDSSPSTEINSSP